MKLTPRLQSIANHIPKNTVCADIGTDHAYIPIYIVKNAISHKVIATDINKGPLARAKKQIQKEGLESQIETRLGNGLDVIGLFEVDTVIIAGMGGSLIKNILDANKERAKTIKTFILQPMIGQRELREYLIKNKFKTIKEDLVQENRRFYEIIIAEQGSQEIKKDIYLDISESLIESKHALLPSFIDLKKEELLKIIHQCEGEDSIYAEEKLKVCRDKLKDLKEVERCL